MTARKPKPRRVGRPSLGDATRSVVLRSKVTPTEAEAYTAIAVRRGVTISDLIRVALSAHADE